MVTRPDGYTKAEWHVDAIADTGDGYTTASRQYVIRCLWCDAVFIASHAGRAKALYDEHVAEMFADYELERND